MLTWLVEIWNILNRLGSGQMYKKGNDLKSKLKFVLTFQIIDNVYIFVVDSKS